MKIAHRFGARRRGATTIEFAFCVPIMLTVVFALVEFSRALQLQQSVRQAAFEGARAGVDLDATTSDVTNAANTVAGIVGIAKPTITITPDPLTYLSPTITVTVSTTPARSGWFLLRFFNKSSVISSTITLNREVQSVSVPGTGS